jgi:hypothetical protein
MKTLRRGSEAFFRDLVGDWIRCKVMHVSGSGIPSHSIDVKFVTQQMSANGFINSGVVLERPATEVVPATAFKFLGYGGYSKDSYLCQETFPEQRRREQRVKNQKQRIEG